MLDERDNTMRRVVYKTNTGEWNGEGWFHKWHEWVGTDPKGRSFSNLYGVIEKVDGSIVSIKFTNIKFVLKKDDFKKGEA